MQTRFGIRYSGEDAAMFPAVCCIRPPCRDVVPYGAGGVLWVLGGPGWLVPFLPCPYLQLADGLQLHLLLQLHRSWCWGKEAALPPLGLFFGCLTHVPASRPPPPPPLPTRGCLKAAGSQCGEMLSCLGGTRAAVSVSDALWEVK